MLLAVIAGIFLDRGLDLLNQIKLVLLREVIEIQHIVLLAQDFGLWVQLGADDRIRQGLQFALYFGGPPFQLLQGLVQNIFESAILRYVRVLIFRFTRCFEGHGQLGQVDRIRVGVVQLAPGFYACLLGCEFLLGSLGAIWQWGDMTGFLIIRPAAYARVCPFEVGLRLEGVYAGLEAGAADSHVKIALLFRWLQFCCVVVAGVYLASFVLDLPKLL